MYEKVEIHLGQDSDIPIAMEIAHALPDHFDKLALQAMPDDLKSHPFFLAVCEEKIVGFASVSLFHHGVAEVLWMAVLPEFRRRKIGKRMIDYISETLGGDGVRLLKTKTLGETPGDSSYEATRRFYETNGFILLETIEGYPHWRPGNPCALYVKVL